MRRPSIWQIRIVAIFKKALFLAALGGIAYGGYLFYLTYRPDLPETGAEWVAQEYLLALRVGDYERAYLLVSAAGQARSSPAQMQQICREVYASIDNWQLGSPHYRFTHTFASVPVTLYYRATWSPETVSVIRGNLNFKLDGGEWRLVHPTPFINAIRQQREEQHLGA
ncbi:MAG: hypothetical protein ACUVX8_13105 [Candidatus Zipacnadales bacterium]